MPVPINLFPPSFPVPTSSETTARGEAFVVEARSCSGGWSDLCGGASSKMAGLAARVRPGSWGGLVLRTCQLAFAAASFCTMGSSPGLGTYTPFYVLMTAMFGQSLWSLLLALLDGCALKFGMNLRTNVLLRVFLIGDWVASTVSFAAAASSAGLVFLLEKDMQACRIYAHLHCGSFILATGFGYVAWALSAISAMALFWMVAATV
ncbi:hypothetical protein EJB05_04908 [Eragrostis curvula]|uniref:CASP-like protein n=1 Tax=Eragrostis curvula TaxID=38414 RepID=A0A5J9WBR2_9POAL|nr:hypothetical protein EJB05_04908 [Eragrostis curvula]